jgi:hypothetical protein
MLEWAKQNWYWLAGGAAVLGAAGYTLHRHKSLGEAPCDLYRPLKTGPQGEVVGYTSPSGRCATCDFLAKMPASLRKRMEREFDRLVQNGSRYYSDTFRPLRTPRTIWKVKAFDHRLYGAHMPRGSWVRLLLLRGWVKDKTRGLEEIAHIRAAQDTYAEYESRRSACDL